MQVYAGKNNFFSNLGNPSKVIFIPVFSRPLDPLGALAKARGSEVVSGRERVEKNGFGKVIRNTFGTYKHKNRLICNCPLL
jgi:hypothetical protein